MWDQNITGVFAMLRPILDIGLLAFLLFKTYEILEKTQAGTLLRGVGLLALIYAIAYFFQLSTLQWLLGILGPGLFVVIVIVFQPELRKIIMRLGQGEFFNLDTKPRLGQLEAVVTSAEILSRQARGALVVFPRKVSLRNIIDTGTRLNADLSSSLIVTIFAFDGPLHDGAIVLHGARIAAAGCLLPLSDQEDIRKSFGTRHRAALGMSEQSDAVILVVSEETGAISLAYESKLYYGLSSLELQHKLKELLDKSARAGGGESTDSQTQGASIHEERSGL